MKVGWNFQPFWEMSKILVYIQLLNTYQPYKGFEWQLAMYFIKFTEIDLCKKSHYNQRTSLQLLSSIFLGGSIYLE